jgi:hypothetical protein
MITRIKAERYRCLQSIDQAVGPFQILVGPNGSGKSAFLEVVVFLATLVSEGLENAVTTENFSELVWQREGSGFTISIEAELPERSRVPMGGNVSRSVCYEVEVQTDPVGDSVIVANETVSLSADNPEVRIDVVRRQQKSVLFKEERGDGAYSFDLPRNLSGLGNLPPDESKFPGAIWLKNLLLDGVQYVILDNELLRGASPPYQGKPKVLDGFTFPRLVARLMEHFPELFKDWIAHVRTALPDLETVYTVVRPEDKYRYLMLRYRDGVELPSWAASDGTLRLLAMTILAYLTDFKGIYLIEEPENGVHPSALETIFQSLSSVYEGQVLVASHSPILLSLANPEQLLCFHPTPSGTQIVRGADHPLLRQWKGEVSLGDLFASGVLT